MCNPLLISVLGLVLATQAPEQKVEVSIDATTKPTATENQQSAEVIQALTTAIVKQDLQSLVDMTEGRFLINTVTANESGLTMTPVDDALRAQLKLTDGAGLLVTSVTVGGPAEKVGLKVNDILLTMCRSPLCKLEDFDAALEGVPRIGAGIVDLTLIREGKPLTFKVKPHIKVTLGADEPAAPKYWIGVHVTELDPALRTHLNVPGYEGVTKGNQGLIVSVVTADSPAHKAGVAVHDILMTYNYQALTDNASLVALVQAAGGKTVDVVVLRAGAIQTLKISPDARKIESTEVKSRPSLFRLTDQPNGPLARYPAFPQMQATNRIDNLHEQIDRFTILTSVYNMIQNQSRGQGSMGGGGRMGSLDTMGGMGSTAAGSRTNTMTSPQLQTLQAEIKELRMAIEEQQKALKDQAKKP